MVSDEKLGVSSILVPVYVMFCSSLGACRIFSLSLVFSSLTKMCLGVVFFVFFLLGVCRASWNCKLIFFTKFMKILPLTPYLFLSRFSLSSSSATSVTCMSVQFVLSTGTAALFISSPSHFTFSSSEWINDSFVFKAIDHFFWNIQSLKWLSFLVVEFLLGFTL